MSRCVLIRSAVTAGAILALSLAAACADESTDDTTAEPGSPTPTASAAVETGAVCGEVAEAMAGAFPEMTLIEDEGRYSVGGEEGSGCRTLVEGTAEELSSFVEVSQTLRALLEDAGWTEDINRAADGPTGTLAVFERDGEMAVLAAGASPSDPSACGPDEVVSACFGAPGARRDRDPGLDHGCGRDGSVGLLAVCRGDAA